MVTRTNHPNTLTAAPSYMATTQTGTSTQEVILPGLVEADGLFIQERALEPPAADQVLVEVEASGISFAERAMRRGRYGGQPKFPFVPGYDLVGRVIQIGPNVDPALMGQRVAALTKTGGWASHTIRPAAELLPVPEGLDAAQVEALIVNGLTAWQMLYREAKVQAGQTIVVYGANGGVGTVLIQLARHQGLRVIGLASPAHHDRLRQQGVEPLDYRASDLLERIRQLAPEGVDAVFDNVGGPSVARSFGLLKRGGALVSYAIASAMQSDSSLAWPFVKLLSQLAWYTILPNGRRASLYHIWSGQGKASFMERMKEDFTQLMSLLAKGVLTPPIAARFPLAQIQAALTMAESRSLYGKIILVP